MGQWIQEGERTIYETVISVEQPTHKLEVPSDAENLDGLNFLAGKRVDEVNKMAELGTQLAHVDGGVTQHAYLRSDPERKMYRRPALLLRKKPAASAVYLLGVNNVQPTGCRGLQEEYVCPAQQTWIRRRIQSYPRKTVSSMNSIQQSIARYLQVAGILISISKQYCSTWTEYNSTPCPIMPTPWHTVMERRGLHLSREEAFLHEGRTEHRQ